MNTIQKGELAVLNVLLRCQEKGIIASRPIVEGTRYDLILDTDNQLKRIQVKYADSASKKATGAITVNLTKSHRRSGDWRARKYSNEEIDGVIVYSPEVKKLFYFPIEEINGKGSLAIRLVEAKNGQTKGCFFAKDYEW